MVRESGYYDNGNLDLSCRGLMNWLGSLHSELAQNYSFLKPFLLPVRCRERKNYYLYIYLGDWVYYSERRREGASVRRGLVAALVRVPCPPDMI